MYSIFRTLIGTEFSSRRYSNAVQELFNLFSEIPTQWLRTVISSSHKDFLLPERGIVYMPILGQLETMVRELLTEIEFEEEDLQLLKLSEAGWRSIPFTSFIAADLDGKLIMSLYGAHCEIHIYEWSELYDQLKLRWHLRRRR